MDLNHQNIAIIGGGPGGLTLARLLQMTGATVNVYERDAGPHVRVQGATLDLHHDTGLRALQHAGLMNEFMANYRPGADKMCIADKNGEIVFAEQFNGEDEMFRPEIDRGPLRNILLNSLQPGTVIWNSNFTLLEQRNNACRIEFTNGTEAYADIVVAADGANSKLRPYLTSARPFYTGITAVEGIVYNAGEACPTLYKMINGGKIFAMGDEKTLIAGAKGDGCLMFYMSCHTPEDWARQSGINFTDKAEMFDWFKKEFNGWSEIWYPLFENAHPVFTPRPQYCMPLNQCWDANPNLTILGDAAHLMPPYAGEGVNMAMLDALELAQCLNSNSFTDSLSAITAYEEQMRRRASAVAKDTLEQTRVLHSVAALDYMLSMFNPQ